jgi:hypothetical protein
MKRILGVLAVVAALAGTAHAGPTGADLKAALVRCAEVTYPAPLSGCGDDPLTAGRLEVNTSGDVAATLTGAAPGALYDVVLHAANASAQLPIAVLATDAMGNASIHWASVFDMGQAGIVAFTLGRNGSVQFVAGFRGRHELEAGLVPCAAINTPAALGGCGADALKSGKAAIDEGDLKVELNGEPNQSYGVVFRGLGGGADVALGTLTTDKKGKGALKIKDVVGDDVAGAGNVVLQRDGLDQFLTGFQSTRKRPVIVARFQVGLIRCADVNTLAPFTDCGFDQLNKGEVIIDDKGDVNVHVMGAVARSTYEVVFVGADATTEVPVGTLTTNPAGNGHLIARDVFPVGARGVGHIIVKRDGADQFVTGFAVSR